MWTCKLCVADKDPAEFPTMTEGFYAGKQYPYCNQCTRERSKAYYQKNKDRVIARTTAYAKKRPDIRAKIARGYNERNPGWRHDHYIANRERTLKQTGEYQKDHRDMARQACRKWTRNNPDKVNANTHARQARIRGNGGRYTAAQWRVLVYLYGNRCLKCNEVTQRLSVDHVVPVSRGGRNDIGNLQPLCQRCNSSKGAQHIDYRSIWKVFP